MCLRWYVNVDWAKGKAPDPLALQYPKLSCRTINICNRDNLDFNAHFVYADLMLL